MTRAALTAWLERRWYGGVAPGLILRALAALFAALAALRCRLYRRGVLRREHVACPLIVVGNLTVGGAGKTPLTEALITGLRAYGWRPGVVSRGYGGSVRVASVLPINPDPRLYGDEPCLLAQRTGVPIAVGRDRRAAAQALLATGRVDLLIADDALQHLPIQGDIEILVIDARRRHGNGRLLPAGPLREPVARAARCDFRVINGAQAMEGDAWPMALHLARAERVDGQGARSLDSFKGEAVNALAGIADPARFFAALAGQGIGASLHPFPDHHDFRLDDFAFDDGRPLLMTAKDAIKCRAFAKSNWYAVIAEPLLDPAFFAAVHARLLAVQSVRSAAPHVGI